MILERRWYQAEAKDRTLNFCEGSKRGENPIICLPTGTGKSFVIADLAYTALQHWPDQRFMMLTSVKELVKQNSEKLRMIWPSAPLGIFSAGLRKKETGLPIIYGNVQSVANQLAKNSKSFGRIDVLQIDECHLVNPDENTAYEFVIRTLKELNPRLIVIGYTATPYRMKGGLIVGAGIFTHNIYDLTGIDAFNRLVYEGYICPLVPKATHARMDSSNVRMQGGEYSRGDMKNEIIRIQAEACDEMIDIAADRSAWLVFTAGIEDTESVAEILQSKGIDAYPVHSKMPSKQADEYLEAYKAGDIQGLVSADKITTGFDHAPTDFIGMLRLTRSPGLWVQMLGRGVRPSPLTFKENCLVADFAGNTEELGPINDPRIPGRRKKAGGDMPVRLCPECSVYNHAAAHECFACGEEFKFEIKISNTASTKALIANNEPIIERLNVVNVVYNLHEKTDREGRMLSPPSIKVSYWTPKQMINEWICLESPRIRRMHANWWFERMGEAAPATTAEALQRVSRLKTPKAILVNTNKKHPSVVDYIWS